MKRATRKKTAKQPGGRETRNVISGPQRLQKVLAAAGLGSRRQCEELIVAGRVDVDGEVVDELGAKVDPKSQAIRVDGLPLPEPKRVYYAVNKPEGIVSTNRDPSGRPRVIDLLPKDRARLFPVGRLDLHSEGLILLTNDGELANRLTHPRYGVEKTYQVLVAGHVDPETVGKLRRGIRLAEGLARVEHAQIKRRHKKSTVLEMVLREGQNREIRRVMAKVGHKVMRLVRVAMGPVRLGKLPPGEYRRLTTKEVAALEKAAAGVDESSADEPRRGKGRGQGQPNKGQEKKTATKRGAAKPAKQKSAGAKATKKKRAKGSPGDDAGKRPTGGRQRRGDRRPRG
jgi:23S rRNA pseudouridine2605 synthase